MNFRKIFLLFLAMALLLTACAPQQTPPTDSPSQGLVAEPQPPEEPRDHTTKSGLVITLPVGFSPEPEIAGLPEFEYISGPDIYTAVVTEQSTTIAGENSPEYLEEYARQAKTTGYDTQGVPYINGEVVKYENNNLVGYYRDYFIRELDYVHVWRLLFVARANGEGNVVMVQFFAEGESLGDAAAAFDDMMNSMRFAEDEPAKEPAE